MNAGADAVICTSWGGERVVTDACSQSFEFTGKYRDSETGNDYPAEAPGTFGFGARGITLLSSAAS